MNEEMKMVLDMVEQGKITADEGVALMRRIEKDAEGEKAGALVPGREKNTKRKLHVDVFQGGKREIHVAVPLGVVRAGFNIAKTVGLKKSEEAKVLEEIDIEALLAAADDLPEGERMTIVEMTDEEGEQIEVYLQ